MVRAQHQVTELRSALRRIEHRLDVYSGKSPGDDVAGQAVGESPTSDDRAGLMREPMSQQQVSG